MLERIWKVGLRVHSGLRSSETKLSRGELGRAWLGLEGPNLVTAG